MPMRGASIAALVVTFASLSFAQGCYTYGPAKDLRTGMKVRVESSVPVEVRDSAGGPMPIVCRAARFDGRIESMRADTLALRPVRISHAEDQRTCDAISRATLATRRDGTEVMTRRLDRWTTAKTAGVGALLVGAIVLLADRGGSGR